MNELTIFIFENNKIRTLIEKDKPWFIAKDVAKILDINWQGSKTISHVPEEWKGVSSDNTPGGNQQLLVLSEQGLFFFLNRSDKPKALPFQKWVSGMVLPSIRKSGKYEVEKPLEVKVLEVIQELKEKIEQDKPKVEYYQNVLQSESLITTTQIAADLGITPQQLNKKLHELGIQYKVNGQWILTEKYKDRGYTKSKTHAYVDDDGVNQTNIHTYWTEAGREFIMDLAITGEQEE